MRVFKNILNKKYFLVSVLVVFALFLTFVSQTLNSSTHSVSCETNTNCEIISTASSHSDHHEENHCDDPCHIGVSHFGHCGVIIQNSNFNLESISTSKEIAYFKSFIKDPFIKGLRRPPRAA